MSSALLGSGDAKELCQEQSVTGVGLRLSSDLLWAVENAKGIDDR